MARITKFPDKFKKTKKNLNVGEEWAADSMALNVLTELDLITVPWVLERLDF